MLMNVAMKFKFLYAQVVVNAFNVLFGNKRIIYALVISTQSTRRKYAQVYCLNPTRSDAQSLKIARRVTNAYRRYTRFYGSRTKVITKTMHVIEIFIHTTVVRRDAITVIVKFLFRVSQQVLCIELLLWNFIVKNNDAQIFLNNVLRH